MKHKVTFLPSEKTLEIEEGKDLLSAAREAGIYIKSSCGGHASCSDCIIKVKEGIDNLNAPSFEETQLIGNVFHITKERLSCQTMITGEVTIDLSAHDKSVDAEKIKTKSFSPAKAGVRKRTKEEVEAIKEERHQQFKEKEEKRNNWQRHWEKDKDPMKSPGKGGNRRPKPFQTPDKEDEEGES